MDYPLLLSYAKTRPTPTFPKSRSFGKTATRVSAKIPCFSHSRAHKKPSIANGRLLVRANTFNAYGRSSNNPLTDRNEVPAAPMIKSWAFRSAGAALALACVTGAFCCGFATLTGRAKAAPRPGRGIWSTFISSSHNSHEGQDTNPTVESNNSRTDALKAFFEMMVYLASPAAMSPPKLRMKPSEDVDELRRDALEKVKKRMNINEALKKLEGKRNEFANDIERRCFVEMVLVEILIAQGDFKKASQYRDFLERKYTPPSDLRPYLYKAIIYTMLDNNQESEKLWNDFFQADAIPSPGELEP